MSSEWGHLSHNSLSLCLCVREGVCVVRTVHDWKWAVHVPALRRLDTHAVLQHRDRLCKRFFRVTHLTHSTFAAHTRDASSLTGYCYRLPYQASRRSGIGGGGFRFIRFFSASSLGPMIFIVTKPTVVNVKKQPAYRKP